MAENFKTIPQLAGWFFYKIDRLQITRK